MSDSARKSAISFHGVSPQVAFSTPLRFRSFGEGGWIISENPFRIWRVQQSVLRLLQGLVQGQDLQKVVENELGLSWSTAVAVLERFADEGLLELTWQVPEAMLPSVSVIIPVRNRPNQIERCLAALAEVDYPRDRLEIIVVDDASTNDTLCRVRNWERRLPLVVLPMTRHSGAAQARNRGAAVAHGEIFAFTDSDCLPHPAWLRVLATEFVRPNVVAVGGAVLPAESTSWLGRYEAVESPLTHGNKPARVRPRGVVPYLVTANLLVRRNAFLALGGFAPLHPGEDVDLVWRLCESGGRVLYRPRGIVYHDHRDRLWSFLARRASYATSEVVLIQRYPHYRHGIALPLAGLAALIMALLLRAWSRFLPLAGAPLIADLLASARSVRQFGVPVRVSTVIGAELRGLSAVIYWLLNTVARYFSWPVLFAALVGRPRFLAFEIRAIALVSLIGTALADFFSKHPELDAFRFVLARVLDDLANNAGLLFGCVRHRTLRPLQLRLWFYRSGIVQPK